MRYSKLIIIPLTVTMLSACSGTPGQGVMNGGNPNKQDVGTLLGAVGGGVLGSTIGRGAGQTAATIGGALVGGFMGNSVGKSLDNGDRAASQ